MNLLKHGQMLPDWFLQILLVIVGIIGSGSVYYYLSQKRPIAALWSGYFAIVILMLCVAFYIQNTIVAKQIKTNIPVFNGKIIADNEDTHWVPQDVFSLMLGDDLQVLTRSSEHFIFSKDSKPFLKLRVINKELFITASIFDHTGQYIVKIIDNEFQASQERAFNPKQPDEHTLIVRDFEGIEVLNIRYINAKVIRLIGKFNLPGYSQPIEILPKDGIRWPGGGGIGHLTVDLTQGSGGFIEF